MNGGLADPVLSVVVPCFNEYDGLPDLFAKLTAALDDLVPAISWEVIVVDDHSLDGGDKLLRKQCDDDLRWRYLRLAVNHGSHLAIAAGLAEARGACAVFLAADLQDPPEVIGDLLARWRTGAHTVWAVRGERLGISWMDRAWANVFYWLLNRFSRIRLPPSGSDFVLMDQRVYRQLVLALGPNPFLMGEIAALGFRQDQVVYTKLARQFGVSHWNIRRKFRAALDAIVSFSYAPLRAMVATGLVSSCIGLLYSVFIAARWLFGGNPVPGWSSLMVVVLLMGGIQMAMLGVLGEYLWRTLEEARRRPRCIIEERHGFESDNQA